MNILGLVLLVSLAASSTVSTDFQQCMYNDSASLCNSAISATLQVTLSNEPVLAVAIRKSWPPPQETTTTTITTELTTPSTVSTTSTTPSITPNIDDYLDSYEIDYKDFYTLKDRFDKAEKITEELEREKLAAGRVAYEQKYCADQEGDYETTNLQNTGFNVGPNYEVFPGVGIYRFHRLPLRWEEARRRCERENAHLLVLNSEEEWRVVGRLMKRCLHLLETHFNYYSYIGVHDMRTEGHFETVLGGMLEDTGYVNWMPRQPDNAHHLGENCLTVSRDGQFNDVPCNTSLPYVCEHESF